MDHKLRWNSAAAQHEGDIPLAVLPDSKIGLPPELVASLAAAGDTVSGYADDPVGQHVAAIIAGQIEDLTP